MALLFVYGTLQHPPLLARLIGRVPALAEARLPGHRAAPLRDRAYPGLVVDETATAPGRVLEVDEHEVQVLDTFEGPEYARRDVVVSLADGATVPAQAWLLTGSSSRLAGEGDWSFERFLAQDVHDFLGRSTPGHAHPGAGS